MIQNRQTAKNFCILNFLKNFATQLYKSMDHQYAIIEHLSSHRLDCTQYAVFLNSNSQINPSRHALLVHIPACSDTLVACKTVKYVQWTALAEWCAWLSGSVRRWPGFKSRRTYHFGCFFRCLFSLDVCSSLYSAYSVILNHLDFHSRFFVFWTYPCMPQCGLHATSVGCLCHCTPGYEQAVHAGKDISGCL